MLTALANDVGFELVFSRQLIAHAGPGDIALGISTSGNSRNLLARASARGARRGLLTLGLAGYDGGEHGAVGATSTHCFVVDSRQRAPHPGDPGRARLALWCRAGAVQACLDEDATDG